MFFYKYTKHHVFYENIMCLWKSYKQTNATWPPKKHVSKLIFYFGTRVRLQFLLLFKFVCCFLCISLAQLHSPPHLHSLTELLLTSQREDRRAADGGGRRGSGRRSAMQRAAAAVDASGGRRRADGGVQELFLASGVCSV